MKKVSVFQEMDENLRRREDQESKKALEYHGNKSFKLSLTGQPRASHQKKNVRALVTHKL